MFPKRSGDYRAIEFDILDYDVRGVDGSVVARNYGLGLYV
jgi:hypothetical protein